MTTPAPPSQEQYERACARIALQFVPEMYPCTHCEWPVIDGYCCDTCGSSNPKHKDTETP